MPLPNNITAVIFDMDGTLIDSLGVWADSDRIFAEELGLSYDAKISAAMKKMHYVSACEYLKEYYALDMSAEEIGARIMEIVREKYLHEIPLKPYVLDVMRDLRSRGVKMCVATSIDKSLAEGALKNLGIYDMLEFVITSDEVGVGKESPLIFTRAAEMMCAAPQNTAVFEDSVHAAESAAAAGFFTVGIYDGKYNNEFEEMKRTADMTVKSFGELM